MFGELKAKLAAIEGKVQLLLATIMGQVTGLEKDVTSVDAGVLAIFDKADATIKKAQARGAQPITDARNALTKLSPPA